MAKLDNILPEEITELVKSSLKSGGHEFRAVFTPSTEKRPFLVGLIFQNKGTDVRSCYMFSPASIEAIINQLSACVEIAKGELDVENTGFERIVIDKQSMN